MNWRIAVVIGAAMAPTRSVLAQGEATWLWTVTTQNGDAVVEPGESALVTLELLMESKVYEPSMFAFGGAIFDTVGGQGADSGQILGWTVLNSLDQFTGDLTTTDGVSLFGTNAFQVDLQGPFVTDNPIGVLQFEWMPVAPGEYSVEYGTSSDLGKGVPHEVLVWIAHEPKDYTSPEFWPVSEAAISFQVVPAPASLWVLAAVPMTVRRRRR